jgi:glycosyltransferase involved in cell wall biosynthesis
VQALTELAKTDGSKHVLAAVVVGPGKASFQSSLRYLDPDNDGVRGAIVEIRTRFWKMLYNNPPFLLQQFRQLYRHVADGLNPDLIHAHISYPCGVVARQLARQLKLPYIISDHWLALKRHLQVHPLRHMTYKAMMGAQALIVPTTFMKQELAKASVKYQLPKIVVVPPTVDTSVYHYKSKTQHNQLHLVALAPLLKSKRLELLIDAVAELDAQNIPSRLTVIGSGSHQSNLEGRAFDHHAPVRFVGRQTRKQIATHLLDADAILMASSYETYGPYLAEALSTGTPVLATNLPIWKDIIAPGFGELVEPTVADWVAKIKGLLSTQYQHETIAQFAAIRYSPTSVAQLLATAQESAVQNFGQDTTPKS